MRLPASPEGSAVVLPPPTIPLKCKLHKFKPRLDYELRLFTGFWIEIPTKQLAGPETDWYVALVVRPLSREGLEPIRSDQKVTMAEIPVYICMGNPKGVKRDFKALEKRRFEAMRLLDQGHNQSETARRLKVARQTVSAWRRQYREQGAAGLRQAGRAGRKPLLDAAQRERLTSLLLEGPQAHGFPTPLWSCPRVARLIGDEFGVDYHEGHVWKILRALDWSPQRPVGKARERNEEQIRTWKRKTWTRIKKSPKRRPYARLHRRKRIESEAASLPHLGATRPNTGAAV